MLKPIYIDNFKIDITAIGKEYLLLALQLGFANQTLATHYAISKDKKSFVLFWTEHPKATKLPVSLTPEAVCDIIWQWLSAEAEYDDEPDHDGSNSKGWRVSNDSWGTIDPYGFQAFLRIEPAWGMHGK